MLYRGDIHIHSCLSPCGSLNMSPRAIVKEAVEKGMDLIALTDHNSGRNLLTFARLCREAGMGAIFGQEVTTIEEVHVLCLFPEAERGAEFGRYIESLLPDIPNSPDLLGDQVFVDTADFIEGEVEVSLMQAADISLDQLQVEVKRWGGLFIPAHIDRPSFSLTSQLGFIPDMSYDALERISMPPLETEGAEGGEIPLRKPSPWIRDSDSHHPGSIGQRHFLFEAERADFAGLSEALKGGRISLREHS